MKNLTTLILLFLTFQNSNQNKLNDCILSKLQQTKTPKTTLLTKGNQNQAILLQKIKTNYNLLPQIIKDKINDCKNDLKPLIKKCERFYGEKNCEEINKFTVGLKCPENYIRDDITRCVKNCDKKKIVIDHNCEKFKTYYLKEFKKFNTLEECLEVNKYCERDFDDKEIFIESCKANYKKISFLCVPYCFNEITGNIRDKVIEDEELCLKDYVSVGIPFYDF